MIAWLWVAPALPPVLMLLVLVLDTVDRRLTDRDAEHLPTPAAPHEPEPGAVAAEEAPGLVEVPRHAA